MSSFKSNKYLYIIDVYLGLKSFDWLVFFLLEGNVPRTGELVAFEGQQTAAHLLGSQERLHEHVGMYMEQWKPQSNLTDIFRMVYLSEWHVIQCLSFFKVRALGFLFHTGYMTKILHLSVT